MRLAYYSINFVNDIAPIVAAPLIAPGARGIRIIEIPLWSIIR